MITSETDSSNDEAAQALEQPEVLLDHKRYRQALHIGYVEMERIVEDVIVTEFTRIGEVLMAHGYNTEVIIFDIESVLDGKLYVCGAGLRMSRGFMNNAIVYTGDPLSFKFILQTQNFASRTTEEMVEYHKLTPNWFHKRVKRFMQTTCREIDISHIEEHFTDDWEMLEAPFSVKLRNEYGYYNEIASAPTIEKAFKIGSYMMEEYHVEDGLLVLDKNGREVH